MIANGSGTRGRRFSSSRRARTALRSKTIFTVLLTAAFGFGAMGSAGAGVAKPQDSPSTQNRPAPVVGVDNQGTIRDRYVVVFEKDTPEQAQRSARADAQGRGATIYHHYRHALQGFSAQLSSRALEALRNNRHVSYIEADQEMTTVATQSPVTWGLDRIDQRNLPLNNSYTYTPTGWGVTAYIVDTGIRFSHSAFGGRAVSGFDAIDGGSADDCNGHGTHVAGTVGSATYGVAKAVRLVGVRVLNCQGSGTTSAVISGIDWVTRDHVAGQPAVANMSLGGATSSALDNAVANSINDGVTYAVAAGNSNADACNASPARLAAAVTVGSSTSSDARSSFSNYGTCLDLFAPGSSITSAWHTSDTATNSISGTSMATPHVAGVAALYLEANAAAAPSVVRNAVVNSATPAVLTNVGTGSPNLLVYSPLTPPTTSPSPSECSLPETYSGSLSGTGDYDYHPNGTYFYTRVAGTHRGCLRGPSGADFDLYLARWNGSYWAIVARGEGLTSSEDITYSGNAGYYRWAVRSYSGSGAYTFGMQRP